MNPNHSDLLGQVTMLRKWREDDAKRIAFLESQIRQAMLCLQQIGFAAVGQTEELSQCFDRPPDIYTRPECSLKMCPHPEICRDRDNKCQQPTDVA